MGGRYGALLPLFRLVGVPCIAALWRVESLPRHRGDRPKLNSISPFASHAWSTSTIYHASPKGAGDANRPALNTVLRPPIGEFLTVETPRTCDELQGEREACRSGAERSMSGEVSIFLSSTEFAAVAASSIAAAQRETVGASGDR